MTSLTQEHDSVCHAPPIFFQWYYWILSTVTSDFLKQKTFLKSFNSVLDGDSDNQHHQMSLQIGTHRWTKLKILKYILLIPVKKRKVYKRFWSTMTQPIELSLGHRIEKKMFVRYSILRKPRRVTSKERKNKFSRYNEKIISLLKENYLVITT